VCVWVSVCVCTHTQVYQLHADSLFRRDSSRAEKRNHGCAYIQLYPPASHSNGE